MYQSSVVDQTHLLTDVGLYSLPFVFILFVTLNNARLYFLKRRSVSFLVRWRLNPPNNASRRIFYFLLLILTAAPHPPPSRQNKVRFLKATQPDVTPEDVAKAMLARSTRPFSQPFEVEAMSRIGAGARHAPEQNEDLLIASEAILLARQDRYLSSHFRHGVSDPRRRESLSLRCRSG